MVSEEKKTKPCLICDSEMLLIDEISDVNEKFWLCNKCLSKQIETTECKHIFKVYKVNYGRNDDDIHVVTKCSICGKHSKTHKKKEFDLKSLPVFSMKDYEVKMEIKFNLDTKKRLVFNKIIEETRINNRKKTNAWNIKEWYDGYLKSKMWQKKRVWILDRAKSKCERCNDDKTQLHIHHKTYERVGYEDTEDLIAVCKKCHRILHSENPKLDIVSQFRLHED